jgi:hypothetical protein
MHVRPGMIALSNSPLPSLLTGEPSLFFGTNNIYGSDIIISYTADLT